MLASLVKGVWLGFSIAAPVGPIGILVLTQAIQSGFWTGLANGLGAALADLIYGFVAVAGVRIIPANSRVAPIAGGCVLVALAWKSWRQKPRQEAAVVTPNRLAGMATTFILTLSNPMTILAFAAMVASAGSGAPVHFVAGIFLGSMLWWTILGFAAGWLGRRMILRGAWANRLAGVSLAGFGLWAILHVVLA